MVCTIGISPGSSISFRASRTILDLLKKIERLPTNSGAATWFSFAAELFRQADVEVSLTRITTAQYGAPAHRPTYSVLDTSKLTSLGIGELPQWHAGLHDYLQRPSTKTADSQQAA
jgi:dTDP-4-dehydrorhamnose reductase